MAIPTFYYAFSTVPNLPSRPGRGNVRLFTCGSAPIRPEVFPGLEAILGRAFINRYGMTEGHVITSLPLDGPWPQGSVGLPLAESSCGSAARRFARGGRRGRHACSSAARTCSASTGDSPEATRSAFACGWFDTGDLGRLDGRASSRLSAGRTT